MVKKQLFNDIISAYDKKNLETKKEKTFKETRLFKENVYSKGQACFKEKKG